MIVQKFKSLALKLRHLWASAGVSDFAVSAVSLFFAGFMIYSSRLWTGFENTYPLLPGKRALFLLLLFVPSVIMAWKRVTSAPVRIDRIVLALVFGLSLYLLSCGAAHPWFFIFKWFGRDATSLSVSVAEMSIVAAAVIAPLLIIVKPRKLVPALLLVLLVFFQVYAFSSLLCASGGEALYRDDHPSFMFRLHEFAQTYPAMTDFNPWWNAGVVNSVGSSSGIGSVAIPFFFIWKYFPVHECYTPLVGILFTIVMPLLFLAGMRAVRASWTTSFTAAILSLGASRWFFVWMLHFGTIGSSFSMAFLPLFSLLAYRVCVMHKADWLTLASLVISGFFMAQWPPCLIMLAFFGIGWLFNMRRFRVAPNLKLLAAGIVIGLFMLPNLIAILGNSELLSFVANKQSSPDAVAAASSFPSFSKLISELAKTLAHRFPEVNPLVLVFGVAGVFFIPQKRLRRWIAPTVICLLLLSAWGPFFAKRMQLERMALPAFMLAVVPASIFVGHILKSESPWLSISRSAVFVLLILGGFSVVNVYKGKGYSPYSVMPPGIKAFAQCVHENVPEDGRLLFFKHSSHAFGGGHVAYLPLLAQREMMGSDYYEFPLGMPGYSQDYPPAPWHKTADGVADFMRLHGATHLALRDSHGRYEFIQRSGLFDEIDFRSGFNVETNASLRVCDDSRLTRGLHLFALKGASGGRFYKGAGTTQADCGYLKVSVISDNEAVLRYAWSPLLTVDGNAKIYPVEVAEGVLFIGIKTENSNPVTIRYGGSENGK